MILRESDDFIELTLIDRVQADLPCAGDVQLMIRIQSAGFTGEGNPWIELPVLEDFQRQLSELDANRTGAAEISSISPNEFRLRFDTIDGWGHVGASGTLSRHEQRIDFRFEFCPSRLLQFRRDFEEMVNLPIV